MGLIPQEYQDALEFFSQIPFYVKFITAMTVVSVVLTALIGVGVIIQLNRMIAALRSSAGPTSSGSFSTAPPSSAASATPPPQYGPRTNPYGSQPPYGQSGSGQGGQQPWT